MNSSKSKLMEKALFTILIMALYRFGTYVSIPFVDVQKISEFVKMTRTGIFGTLNTFSGGSIGRMAIFGLGVMPNITASIVMQLAVASFPSLKQIKSEGGFDGRKTISKWTKLLTLVIGFAQGMVFANSFITSGLHASSLSLTTFKLLTAFSLTTGTVILVWLGEICSQKGIGNGLSLIIFGGIVSELPSDLSRLFNLGKNGNISSFALLMLLLIFIMTILLVVFVERSSRLVYVQYPRQAQNFSFTRNQMPKDNFIPLKLNTAGIVPPIFASAVLLLPITILSILGGSGSKISNFISRNFAHGKPLFVCGYIGCIVFFTFFYNTVVFDTQDMADNLKRGNVFIPGCRPGKPTADLLRSIVLKLSAVGALYLSVICLVPELLSNIYGNSLLLGGTSVLIVVGVVMDVVTAIQTSSLPAKYERSIRRYDK